MKKSVRFPAACLSAVCLFVLLPALLCANNLTFFETVSSTDFAMFGAGGMRGQGTGSIVVSGISGTVTSAVLIWHGPTDGNDANASVTFNGTPITGMNIGISNANCWSFTDSRAYSADVTSLVTGNGTYTLANFTKASPVADINGVSLLIFYNDGNPANNRDVVIFYGNDSNVSSPYDADGWNATLSGINYSSGTVNMRLIVADGQTFDDEALVINGTTILPACPSPNWQGDTVPDQGTAGQTGGGLWDHKSFDVTSLMSPGLNTLTIQPQALCSDCLSLVAAIFDLPAGAAPPTPTPTPGGPTPTPTPVGVVVPTVSHGGLLLMAGLLAIAALTVLALKR